jgi:uncharacterized lipoprotein YbaY
MLRLPLLCPLLLLVACASPPLDDTTVVSGTVSYQTKLPPDAVTTIFLADASGPERPIEVDLQKLSSPDPGAELLVFETIEGDPPSPIAYSLQIPVAKVDQGHDYTVKAAVSVHDRILLVSRGSPLVLTKGRPHTADLVALPPG